MELTDLLRDIFSGKFIFYTCYSAVIQGSALQFPE